MNKKMTGAVATLKQAMGDGDAEEEGEEDADVDSEENEDENDVFDDDTN